LTKQAQSKDDYGQINSFYSKTSLAKRILPDFPGASVQISSRIPFQCQMEAEPFRKVLTTIKNPLNLVMLTHDQSTCI
jgi:hypothetical protein